MAGSRSSSGDFQDQRKEKAEKNAQFSFCGKLFVMKLSFEEVNIVFFMAERLVCFEPTKASRFMKKLQVHSELYAQGKYFSKGNFCIYKGFIDVFYILTSAWKKKPQDVPRFEIDFMWYFANDVLSRFNLRERIHDPFGVMRIAFQD